MFYAVKVLQKKSILKKKEVPELGPRHLLSCSLTSTLGWLSKMNPNMRGLWLGAEGVTAGSQVVPRVLTLLKKGTPTTSPIGPLGGPSPIFLHSSGKFRGPRWTSPFPPNLCGAGPHFMLSKALQATAFLGF